jgi:hypothetical protein
MPKHKELEPTLYRKGIKYESYAIKCTIKRRLLLTLCDVHATKHGTLNSYLKIATDQASVAVSDKNDFLTVYPPLLNAFDNLLILCEVTMHAA